MLRRLETATGPETDSGWLASPNETPFDKCPMVPNDVRFYNSSGVNGAAEASWPRDLRWVPEILATIDEFGSASLGLLAWEPSLDESELAPAWEQALRTGLIQRTHTCPATHEDMYSLAGADAPSLDVIPPPRAMMLTPSAGSQPSRARSGSR